LLLELRVWSSYEIGDRDVVRNTPLLHLSDSIFSWTLSQPTLISPGGFEYVF
jgi:hypothetical protein